MKHSDVMQLLQQKYPHVNEYDVRRVVAMGFADAQRDRCHCESTACIVRFSATGMISTVDCSYILTTGVGRQWALMI